MWGKGVTRRKGCQLSVHRAHDSFCSFPHSCALTMSHDRVTGVSSTVQVKALTLAGCLGPMRVEHLAADVRASHVEAVPVF